MTPRKTSLGPPPCHLLVEASMRPRHDAAENLRVRLGTGRYVPASMRPRHDAAENPHGSLRRVAERAASMRPRHDAAENIGGGRRTAACPPRFNEAAA